MYPEKKEKDYLGERSLDLYLREINNTSLLTREQEKKLARRIHKEDKTALDELVKANLIFGCGKPFKLSRDPITGIYKVEMCDYI